MRGARQEEDRGHRQNERKGGESPLPYFLAAVVVFFVAAAFLAGAALALAAAGAFFVAAVVVAFLVVAALVVAAFLGAAFLAAAGLALAAGFFASFLGASFSLPAAFLALAATLILPETPLGRRRTPLSAPRLMALLRLLMLEADERSMLYLVARNLKVS